MNTNAFQVEIDNDADDVSLDSFLNEQSEKENEGHQVYENMQDRLFDIIENEEVEDCVDLNEKFLSQSLGVEQADLGMLPKIELRVDTRYHNL